MLNLQLISIEFLFRNSNLYYSVMNVIYSLLKKPRMYVCSVLIDRFPICYIQYKPYLINATKLCQPHDDDNKRVIIIQVTYFSFVHGGPKMPYMHIYFQTHAIGSLFSPHRGKQQVMKCKHLPNEIDNIFRTEQRHRLTLSVLYHNERNAKTLDHWNSPTTCAPTN